MITDHPKIVSARMEYDDSYTLERYLATGGYAGLRKALTMTPEQVHDEVNTASLLGRGGAGFPAGRKWSMKRAAETTYLVVNGDESEPATFKDHMLIERDPHAIIEGTIISAYAVGAAAAFIFCRGEFALGLERLQQACNDAYLHGALGASIFGSGFSLDLVIHPGAGAYICGEETALLESLEGKRGFPRIKPPYFPAAIGLYGQPTIVNNVETLCHVKHIADMGGEAYSKIGTPNNTVTRILCVSGQVQRPGYYEFEVGRVTMGQLLNEVCGGPLPGRTFKAVIPGGSSAKVLRFGERYKGKRKVGAEMVEYDWGVEDIPMDFDSLAMIGSMGGSGGVIVMDDSVSMVEALGNINAFYSHESCGQCTPCREGSLWMKRITARMVHGDARPGDGALLKSVADQIAGRTICAFGEGCAWPTQSFVAKFGEEFKSYSKETRGPRPDGVPELV